MLRPILFVVVSAAWAYVSLGPLRTPRSHGFYRFFAVEFILILIFRNVESLRQWFAVGTLHQLASRLLLIASLATVVPGLYLLVSAGRPEAGGRTNSRLIVFEKTTRLVTTGVFRYIRHPMYASLLFLGWGVFLKRPSWIAGGACGCCDGIPCSHGKGRGEREHSLFRYGVSGV